MVEEWTITPFRVMLMIISTIMIVLVESHAPFAMSSNEGSGIKIKNVKEKD
jgi:hypothetical protein